MKTENLNPPEVKTKLCPDCTQGLVKIFDGASFFWDDCERCGGTGEIEIEDEYYFDEILADDERPFKSES